MSKCVCDIGDRGGKYGNILYFDSYDGKWLKVYTHTYTHTHTYIIFLFYILFYLKLKFFF
jgi:hypothetical protein